MTEDEAGEPKPVADRTSMEGLGEKLNSSNFTPEDLAEFKKQTGGLSPEEFYTQFREKLNGTMSKVEANNSELSKPRSLWDLIRRRH